MKLGRRKNRKNSKVPSHVLLNGTAVNPRYAESYRTLRANVQFSFMDQQYRTLLVTSAGVGEGKTVTVANLGYTLSKTGAKVLMVDADLRRPFLSEFLPADGSIGLSGILSELFGTDIKAGELSKISVGDLFRLISLQKRTGTLHLSDNGEKIDILFFRGEILHLDWVTRPTDDRLAAVLVKKKMITREQAQVALETQKRSGYRLGYVLVNMGLVKEESLRDPLTLHMMEAMRVVLQMKTGAFRFDDMAESSLGRPNFRPFDFREIDRRMLIGDEDLPFLDRKIRDAIQETEEPNLAILPSGKRPPNPSELLGTERMAFLLSHLRKSYDVILLDTPPVMPATDATILAPLADGVVVVVRSGMLNRDIIQKSIEQLKMARANLVGVVLNRVDMRKDGYYRYYYKYYSHYHEKAHP